MMSLVQREIEVPFSRDAKHACLDARLRMALPIGDDVELAIEVLKAGYLPRQLILPRGKADFDVLPL